MSGGSWDYVSFKFHEVGLRLQKERCSYRKALGKMVLEISQALHEIEWVDSSDKPAGAEMDALKKVIKKKDVLKVLIEDATKIRDQLNEIIDGMKK